MEEWCSDWKIGGFLIISGFSFALRRRKSRFSCFFRHGVENLWEERNLHAQVKLIVNFSLIKGKAYVDWIGLDCRLMYPTM